LGLGLARQNVAVLLLWLWLVRRTKVWLRRVLVGWVKVLVVGVVVVRVRVRVRVRVLAVALMIVMELQPMVGGAVLDAVAVRVVGVVARLPVLVLVLATVLWWMRMCMVLLRHASPGGRRAGQQKRRLLLWLVGVVPSWNWRPPPWCWLGTHVDSPGSMYNPRQGCWCVPAWRGLGRAGGRVPFRATTACFFFFASYSLEITHVILPCYFPIAAHVPFQSSLPTAPAPPLPTAARQA